MVLWGNGKFGYYLRCRKQRNLICFRKHKMLENHRTQLTSAGPASSGLLGYSGKLANYRHEDGRTHQCRELGDGTRWDEERGWTRLIHWSYTWLINIHNGYPIPGSKYTVLSNPPCLTNEVSFVFGVTRDFCNLTIAPYTISSIIRILAGSYISLMIEPNCVDTQLL